MKALVTGATGLIGGHLTKELSHPILLGRETPTPALLAGRDVVFHLAGEPVASGRWTSAKKRRIRESRVLGTRKLVKAIEDLSERPQVLVVASAVGIYGEDDDETVRATI